MVGSCSTIANRSKEKRALLFKCKFVLYRKLLDELNFQQQVLLGNGRTVMEMSLHRCCHLKTPESNLTVLLLTVRRIVNTKDTGEDDQQEPDAKTAPEPPHSSQQMPHRTAHEIKLFPLEISSSIELSTDSTKAKILRAIKEYKNRESNYNKSFNGETKRGI